MDTEEALEAAAAAYSSAEQTYIEALASGADDPKLRDLLARVVESADAWESAAREAPSLGGSVTRYHDLPEVLATLWRDLADAHERRLTRAT